MKDALMLAVQITPEERAISKEIARKMGMTYSGWLGLLVKRELRNSDSASKEFDSASTQFGRCAGDIRDSALL